MSKEIKIEFKECNVYKVISEEKGHIGDIRVDNRGDYVSDNDEYGIAVIAESVKEAKKLAWGHEFLSNENYIDLRAKWSKGSKVEDLPIGVMDNLKEAMRRGIFGSLECDECDMCGEQEVYLSVVTEDKKCICNKCEELMEEKK